MITVAQLIMIIAAAHGAFCRDALVFYEPVCSGRIDDFPKLKAYFNRPRKTSFAEAHSWNVFPRMHAWLQACS